MRVVFFGSDSFALEPLGQLAASGHVVKCVVTRPARPAGRGLKSTETPLASRAGELGLAVRTPDSLTEAELSDILDPIDWDAGVVVAYGLIVPPWLLAAPPAGFVNLHPSLLPRYRGAAPIERALMNGASITGVTTIQMDEGLDSGDILLHREVPINEDDTAATLAERLSHVGAGVLITTLDGLEAGAVEPVAQEEDKATFAPPISAEEGNIDWSLPAENIDRMVRALNPSPGAYTFFRGRRVKIWSVQVTDVPPEDEPGTLMNMGKEGFLVNTGSSCLTVVSLQPEGKQRMTAGEFSRGQRLLVSERFRSGPES